MEKRTIVNQIFANLLQRVDAIELASPLHKFITLDHLFLAEDEPSVTKEEERRNR